MSHLYDHLLGDPADADRSTRTGNPCGDDVLTGLAIFEAHANGDGEALDVLLSGQSAGEALHATLNATELLVEFLALESRFDIDSIIAALRRQVVQHQATH